MSERTLHQVTEPFDKESVHDEQIMPLLVRIRDICQEHDIPMLCSFLYGAIGEPGDLELQTCTTVQYFNRGGVPEFREAGRILIGEIPMLAVRATK